MIMTEGFNGHFIMTKAEGGGSTWVKIHNKLTYVSFFL